MTFYKVGLLQGRTSILVLESDAKKKLDKLFFFIIIMYNPKTVVNEKNCGMYFFIFKRAFRKLRKTTNTENYAKLRKTTIFLSFSLHSDLLWMPRQNVDNKGDIYIFLKSL